MGRFALGSAVRVEMAKWPDRPHWAFDAVWLGADDHGEWLGMPAGTPMSRPGRAITMPHHQLMLVPSPSAAEADRWWTAALNPPEAPHVTAYVDIASPPVWEGTTVRAVDLDLDVVREVDGRVFVDDEDEFADHQVAYGYPASVVEAARRSCDAVLAAVTAGHPPYDGSHEPWLRVLADHLLGEGGRPG